MSEPKHYVLKAETGFINLSPLGFRRWALHYLKCWQDFEPPDTGFSPVPYFLLCRTLELQFKAWHLESKRQFQVKKDYGHNLIASYEDLPQERKNLSEIELDALRTANAMYMDKGFEYMMVMDAATGFSRAPNLQLLETIAQKVIANDG